MKSWRQLVNMPRPSCRPFYSSAHFSAPPALFFASHRGTDWKKNLFLDHMIKLSHFKLKILPTRIINAICGFPLAGAFCTFITSHIEIQLKAGVPQSITGREHVRWAELYTICLIVSTNNYLRKHTKKKHGRCLVSKHFTSLYLLHDISDFVKRENIWYDWAPLSS